MKSPARPPARDIPVAYPEPGTWVRVGAVATLVCGWVLLEVVAMLTLAGSGLPILAGVTALLCGGAAGAIRLTARSTFGFLPARRARALARAHGRAAPLPVAALTTVQDMPAGATGWVYVEDVHPGTNRIRADAYVQPVRDNDWVVQVTRTFEGWTLGPLPEQAAGAGSAITHASPVPPVTVPVG